MIIFKLKGDKVRYRRWSYKVLDVYHSKQNLDYAVYDSSFNNYQPLLDVQLDKRHRYFTIHATGYTAMLYFINGKYYYERIRAITDTDEIPF